MRQRSNTRRSGIVVIQVAFSLTALLGCVALALDGGLLLEQRRRAQAGADAAALAAAFDLYAYASSNNGGDYTGTAKASALANAAANGYANDGAISDVKVNIPPTSGFAKDKPGYAEVIITYYQKRGFSSIFGSGDIPVAARSVARGLYATNNTGIIILDPAKKGALSVDGNGALTVVDTPVIVNSIDPQGATFAGNGQASAPEWDFSGTPGYVRSGGRSGLNGTIKSGQAPTPDPLAYLPEPDRATLPIQSFKTLKLSGNDKNTVLYPGVYEGGISISGNADVTLMPGIYYIAGGGISLTSNNASIVGNGVMIFNGVDRTGASNAINITSAGGVNITPPTTGPYQGINIFQTRSSTQGIDVSGNGDLQMTGAFYAAKGSLNISGNGTVGVIGSQYISYNLNISGNGAMNVVWKAKPSTKTRIIGMVE